MVIFWHQICAVMGHIDFIGQFEDDFADLIDHYARLGQKVVLAGYSSGGGLAIRFLAGKFRHKAHSSILLAPCIYHIAPTMRPNAGGGHIRWFAGSLACHY